MRIAYENIIDDLTSTSVSALTELSGYPIANVQEQRLAVKYKTSDATTQSVVFTLPTVAEIPDDPAGVTYIQDAWATVDGWLGNLGTTVSTDAGRLKLVYDGTGIVGASTYKTISTWSTKTVRMRFVSTNAIIKLEYYNGTSYINVVPTNIISAYEWIVDFIPTYTGINFIVLINRATAVANTCYIDWVYVGTGAYLPNSLIDNSGNGNGITIKGSTPVLGTSGNALSRDGVNDYEVTDAVQTMPDLFWYHEIWTVPNHATQIQILFGNASSGSPLFYFYRNTNNRDLIIAYWNGSTTVTMTSTNFFPATTIPVVADIVANWLTGSVLVYKDGALFTTLSMTSAIKPTPQLWYFGNQSALSSIQYAGGIVENRKVYNRNPSTSEILHLYNREPWENENNGLIADWQVDKNLDINTVAILGHNITAMADVKIQATNSTTWPTTPELNETITHNTDIMLKFLSSSYTYKYWKFSFTGQGDIEIGRLWLGKYITIDPSSTLDFTVSKRRSDNVIHGRNRQKYASIGSGWKVFDLSFPPSNDTMVNKILTWYDYSGNHSSFIFCNFDSIRDYEIVEPCYCSLNDNLTFTHSNLMKFSYNLQMEEEK